MRDYRLTDAGPAQAVGVLTGSEAARSLSPMQAPSTETGKKMMRRKGPRQWDTWSLIVINELLHGFHGTRTTRSDLGVDESGCMS